MQAKAIAGPGLESEQVLRLFVDGGSVMDVCGNVNVLEDALARALPGGVDLAGVYLGTHDVSVRLGVDDVAAAARLRDLVITSSAVEDALNDALPTWKRPLADEELADHQYTVNEGVDGRPFYLKDREASRQRPTVENKIRVRVDQSAFMDCYVSGRRGNTP